MSASQPSNHQQFASLPPGEQVVLGRARPSKVRTSKNPRYKAQTFSESVPTSRSCPNLLPDPAPNSTVPLATPFTCTKGTRIVPKRRFQKGTFVKRNGQWVGMWRVDVLQPDGTIKREQRSKTFVGLSEQTTRAAFRSILDSMHAASGATPPVPQ